MENNNEQCIFFFLKKHFNEKSEINFFNYIYFALFKISKIQKYI